LVGGKLVVKDKEQYRDCDMSRRHANRKPNSLIILHGLIVTVQGTTIEDKRQVPLN
jgi:hypothetical protein